ncbi:SAM-dependent methyltransferase [Plantactinospora siamensis]|uniref:SAM-dependent methyltransferase n=1 Tax=Plantactinospora siamensis TaxID=555372 RepID=A0ABV6P547_9ACTN
MENALYGPDGFFVTDPGPAGHFRTSAQLPAFATALAALLSRLDAELGHPAPLEVVDVGAGRGELLRALAAELRTPDRVRLMAVERAPRPADLPAAVEWRDEIPAGITGLLLGTEWLDNVPLELAVPDGGGWRYLLVDPASGAESVGDPVGDADRSWLARWWPAERATARVEIGRTRDDAWAAAVRRVGRGLALAVDYGHLRSDRPPAGTLTGYRHGRQVVPVPDGSCDLTAHVALDSVGAAGSAAARRPYLLVRQREALRALGTDGRRPPLGLASTDPAGYLRSLAAASTAAELTDPDGLGGHRWLLQPVGLEPIPLLAGLD